MQDLHGLLAFLQLEPLHEKSLFLRTIERPIKSRDPAGLKHLQVCVGGSFTVRCAAAFWAPLPQLQANEHPLRARNPRGSSTCR